MKHPDLARYHTLTTLPDSDVTVEDAALHKYLQSHFSLYKNYIEFQFTFERSYIFYRYDINDILPLSNIYMRFS